jgi:hypothetical protein
MMLRGFQVTVDDALAVCFVKSIRDFNPIQHLLHRQRAFFQFLVRRLSYQGSWSTYNQS